MLSSYLLKAFRRDLVEPLYCLLKGAPLRNYWNELEKTQYLSENVLLDKQWQKLQEILRYAYEFSSFYKERFAAVGITPDMIKSTNDLSLIQILTKDEIRRNTPMIISSEYIFSDLLNFKTGGSTGKALDIYLTEECSYMRNACARRHDRWSGWDVGEPIAAVWGNPSFPVTLKAKLKEWLISPIIYLDTMSVSRQSVEKFARQWDHLKPSLLFGHAHSIFLFAQFVKELNLENIKPKGIISSSMMLLPYERRFIEEVFGVKVTDRYGCEEVSLVASECEMHNGMHLNIEHLFIEFIKEDGTPARPGEPGKIVVTDLMNRAMPLIRYQVEDVGVPSGRKCSCGRGLPLMESVAGRVADFLKKRDGVQIAGISLIENTLTKYPGLEQMQIIQNDFDDFMVRVVPGPGYHEDVLDALTIYFKELFGYDIVITFEKTASIPSEASGKFRFTICKIN